MINGFSSNQILCQSVYDLGSMTFVRERGGDSQIIVGVVYGGSRMVSRYIQWYWGWYRDIDGGLENYIIK